MRCSTLTQSDLHPAEAVRHGPFQDPKSAFGYKINYMFTTWGNEWPSTDLVTGGCSELVRWGWCTILWSGLVWSGLVWCGVVWCGEGGWGVEPD
jgi:hypothetical protein